ncbi:MAG: citrate synthase [Fusobacteria bacterium]|nr:citrate synthase [Fusobacteriota bacterium]
MTSTKIEELAKDLLKENKIDSELYKIYNVKRGLRDEHGKGVVVGLTKISEVHGYLVDEGEKIPDKGKLLYRGINLNELVRGFQKDGRFGFEETSYLLLFGKLPNNEELKWYKEYLSQNRFLSKEFIDEQILRNPSYNLMNALQRAVLALYSFDENPDEVTLFNVLKQSLNLIAKIPTMMAYTYLSKINFYKNKDIQLYEPKKEYSTAENLLYLIRGNNNFTSKEAETLDLALVLHADHGGGNNSSFTNYVISSSGTDTYSAIAASIGSLKGPKHGGANKKVVEMMEYISEAIGIDPTDEEIKEILRKILKKQAFDQSGLIYGMGHAVYTTSDPRAILFKEKAYELAEEKNLLEAYYLFTRVEELTKVVLKELKGENFVICANVDFYSGLIYSMMEIPAELFTPLFAVARIVGWCALRMEQIVCDNKIIRPAYKGIKGRIQYININER